MHKSKTRHKSVKYSQNFTKSYSGHLHHVPKQYVLYHYPSSVGSPDILLTRLLYYTKCQSWKREIFKLIIYIFFFKS